MRKRHFAGSSFKPRNVPENAQTPTTMAPALFAGDRVHAVLGGFMHSVALQESQPGPSRQALLFTFLLSVYSAWMTE